MTGNSTTPFNGESNLTFDGSTLTVNGSIVETSTQKIKENIVSIPEPLNSLLQLRGVIYNKIGNDTKEIGLIAEEVYKIFPELISFNKNGEVQGVEYSRVVSILIEAIKELNVKVENQNIFINELLDRIIKLENK